MFAETFALSAGTSGLFQSRAFMPAFLTACMLRWKQGESLAFDIMVNNQQITMTSNTVLAILGVLALVEMLAQKNPDMRAVLNEFDQYIKAGMAYLTYMGITAATSATVSVAPAQEAGMFHYGAGLFIAALTFWLAGIRRDTVQLLFDADEDDDLGLQWLISFAEDIWAIFGLFILIFIPVFGLTLIGLVSALIWYLRHRAYLKEEKAKVPCTNCNEMMCRSAPTCPSCKHANADLCDVGFFGAAVQRPASDPQSHALKLVSKKRCPVCATRWPERSVDQTCAACGHALFHDSAFADAYLQTIDARLPKVLGISFLFGLIPIVGAIPGVIYFRLALVGPYRQYLSRFRNFFVRWGIRVLMLVMLAVQWVPGIGAVSVSLLAFVSHRAYRNAFAGRLASRDD